MCVGGIWVCVVLVVVVMVVCVCVCLCVFVCVFVFVCVCVCVCVWAVVWLMCVVCDMRCICVVCLYVMWLIDISLRVFSQPGPDSVYSAIIIGDIERVKMAAEYGIQLVSV